MKPIFSGFVYTNDGEFRRVQIYNDSGSYAYVSDTIADDAYTAEEFANYYGEDLYLSVEDFKTNKKAISVFDVWVIDE